MHIHMHVYLHMHIHIHIQMCTFVHVCILVHAHLHGLHILLRTVGLLGQASRCVEGIALAGPPQHQKQCGKQGLAEMQSARSIQKNL